MLPLALATIWSHLYLLWYFLIPLAIFAFFPIRAWTYLRSNRIDVTVDASEPRVSILLIHGTFAHGAKWTGATHRFTRGILATVPGCRVSRMLWSGDNSHAQRRRAATGVLEWVSCEAAERIYLIGHSHGGLVAAMAATQAKDPRVTVITMSTPFLNVRERFLGLRSGMAARAVDELRVLFGYFCVLALTVSYSLILHGWSFLYAVLTVLLALVALFIASHFGRGVSTLRLPIAFARRYAARLTRESTIALPPGRLLILRATGDEASGLLITGQFASGMLQLLLLAIGAALRAVSGDDDPHWRSRYRLSMWVLAILILIGSFARIAYLLHTPSAPLDSHRGELMVLSLLFALILTLGAFSTMPFSLLAETALVTIGSVASIVFHIPFGIEIALVSPVLSLSAEAAPIGKWPVTTVAPHQSLLAHSHLYETDEVFTLLAQAEATNDAAPARPLGVSPITSAATT
ncbi:alpha/beta hydrolase [Trinickia caryophylli]|uniref:Putative serine esterase n=1 Tax=Trinickia caryophylli TaxID=28094 RepID=A0A1X7FI63_TRICW|nr:alpha/beta hydrolase [Trinickia caryophylli]PMS13222.1 hypothetical protein C0Z17_05355 [Trinickia caryophylli]TRX19251.1 hypothetical protein FNF07_14115 [Trinickia caryophylli]WQE13449.1 alpha/beta hydrolase [Trinickia caryophylli]SMF52591.1 Putative serine esterase [Trinickia caryophylli]GLU34027.1 hypothetical protein Busp01_38690 [Trinickia caryophylli]